MIEEIARSKYLERWFDKSDIVETLDLRSELTTNGGRSFRPSVLSPSKDGPLWLYGFEIVS